MKLNNNISKFLSGKIIRNSTWGVSSSIIQNIFYSVFFLIVARKYGIEEFSSYVISNNIYGLMLSFSAMGLGQWFIRSMIQSEEKSIIEKFFKIQVILGIIFYLLKNFNYQFSMEKEGFIFSSIKYIVQPIWYLS